MKTNNHTLPTWSYESLPYVYFIVGILVILVFENNWAIFSGCTWFLVGAIVLWMRATHRNALRDLGVGGRNGNALVLRGLDSGSLEITWSKAFESGNRDIDEQHHGLFDAGNALLKAINSGRPQADVELLLEMLLNEVKTHFSFEEKLLEKWGHPAARGHKAIHERLLVKANEMRNLARIGALTVGDFIGFFVNDLLLQHVLKEDKKFFYQV